MSDVALYTNSIQTPEGTLLLINDFFIVQVMLVLKAGQSGTTSCKLFCSFILYPKQGLPKK